MVASRPTGALLVRLLVVSPPCGQAHQRLRLDRARRGLALKPLNDPAQDENKREQDDDNEPEICEQIIDGSKKAFEKHGDSLEREKVHCGGTDRHEASVFFWSYIDAGSGPA